MKEYEKLMTYYDTMIKVLDGIKDEKGTKQWHGPDDGLQFRFAKPSLRVRSGQKRRPGSWIVSNAPKDICAQFEPDMIVPLLKWIYYRKAQKSPHCAGSMHSL